MNHCGRPECPGCGGKKCCKAPDGFHEWECPEKPVQEKEELRERINGKANCGCECHEKFTYLSHGNCCFILKPLPAAPASEAWEGDFDEHYGVLFDGDESIYKDVKSFITNIIRQTGNERYQKGYADGRGDFEVIGAKAERARIEKAVGELKMQNGFMPLGMLDDPWNKTIDAVLKIINSQGSSDMVI